MSWGRLFGSSLNELWYVINSDLVCMLFCNNDEINQYERNGLDVVLYIGCCNGMFVIQVDMQY